MPPGLVIAERDLLCARARDAEVASGRTKVLLRGNEGGSGKARGNMFQSAIGRAIVDNV